MTKHRPKRESEPFDYWSPTHTLDEEPQPLTMFCPRCQQTVKQIKSFWRKEGKLTDEAVVRCAICGLVYNSGHYNNLMKLLKAEGFKFPI